MKKKKISIFKFILFPLLILSAAFGTYQFYYWIKDRPVSFALHLKSENSAIEKWVKFESKEENFSVRFPTKPEYINKKFPIPRSKNRLAYHEYQCKDQAATFSVSYTSLPTDWLKWGSKIVLKGAMKVVLAQLKGVHLIGQSTNTFKSYPSLDFEHYLGDQETAGTLILVNSVLYKIEISYLASEREKMHKELAQFVESFELKN